MQPRQQLQHGGQQPLPHGWVQATDPSTGKVYYCNPITRETRWERPITQITNMAGLEEAPQHSENSIEVTGHSVSRQQIQRFPWQSKQSRESPPGWVETKDPSSGRVYFYNPQTRETQWERPSSMTSTPSTSHLEIQVNSDSNKHYADRDSQSESDAISDRTCHVLKKPILSSEISTAAEANNSIRNADIHQFNELRSLTSGQIAHLIKMQKRQQAQFANSEEERQVELLEKPAQDLFKYVPIRLSLMSSLSAMERTEPGRLDVRMHALREELKKFGYSKSS